MRTKKEGSSLNTTHETANSNDGMVVFIVLRGSLADCAISRPPCCLRTRSVLHIVI